MSSGIALIAFLLVLIVMLLAEKQEERPRSLARMIGFGILGLVVYHIGPFIVGIVVIAGTSLFHLVGPRGIIFVFCGVIYGGLFCRVAWEGWQDHRDNRAIRAGSVAAFDERVKMYMENFGYDRPKAIAATERIRDRKRRKTYRIRIKAPLWWRRRGRKDHEQGKY